MYYFGCISQPGHYLWQNEGKKLWYGELPDDFPEEWTFKEPYGAGRTYAKESRLAPNCSGPQGIALIQKAGGWTCLSFPDRSVDSRPNCVSAFLERGDLLFEEIMVIAEKEYPSVLNRFDFEIEFVEMRLNG